MPGHSGGALAISQVETEYFIWFDDDFQEGILTVAHSFSHSSDHSSGKVGFDNHVTNFQQKTRFYIERNKDGFCSDRRPTPYHVKIPEYPDCQITDIVTNYFIARTTSGGTIRMDPQFRERAHKVSGQN